MGFYNKNFYADSYSSEVSRSSEVPVIDRYAGKDQMIQKGILFTAFTGYRIFDSFSLGLQFNTVGFDRNGDYLNQNKDDYGNVDNYISSNKDFKLRTQDYKHTDVAIGLAYSRNNEFTIGVKGGLLTGDVDQNHLDENTYLYQYNEPNVSDEWYYHMSDYNSAQTWNHEGNYKIFGL